ncbi:MAG: hypothetical protein J3K34DRAFT_499609, partial [Monoraphidium minutum]
MAPYGAYVMTLIWPPFILLAACGLSMIAHLARRRAASAWRTTARAGSGGLHAAAASEGAAAPGRGRGSRTAVGRACADNPPPLHGAAGGGRRSGGLLSAPRLRVQLTPLPRVSLEFDPSSGGRRGSSSSSGRSRSRAGSGNGRAGSGGGNSAAADEPPLPSPTLSSFAQRQAPRPREPPPPGSASGGAATSAAAAACGQAAAAAPAGGPAEPASGAAVAPAAPPALVVDGRALPGARAAPGEATAALGADARPASRSEAAALAAAVTEAHLLQFGAMLGERSCLDALARGGLPGPVAGAPAPPAGAGAGAGAGAPDARSLYGAADAPGFWDGWEPIADEAAPGVLYRAWRRPLRRGLHLYHTRAVFLGVAPAQLRAFVHDDGARVAWDPTMARLAPASAGGAPAGGGESGVLLSVVRFPKPMAPRSYTGSAVRAAPAALLARAGHRGPAAELSMVYFEDSHVRAGFANLAVKKGLYPAALRFDRALRLHVCGGAAAAAGACGRRGGVFGSAPSSRRASCELPGDDRGAAVAAVVKAAAAAAAAAACTAGGRALRAAALALRAAAAVAGALWEAHARLAALLPRFELRLLRSLLATAAPCAAAMGIGASNGGGPRGRSLAAGGPAALSRHPPLSRPLFLLSHPIRGEPAAGGVRPPRRARALALPSSGASLWRRAARAAAALLAAPATGGGGSGAAAGSLRALGAPPRGPL